jgi:hypothetical protein
MRGVFSLVMAGVVALTLGVLGTVALASSMKSSTPDPADTANVQTAVPGVYGAR